jgi:hypothetical protein
MTFQDLPHDLSLHPLTDPRLVADVLDLCVPSGIGRPALSAS